MGMVFFETIKIMYFQLSDEADLDLFRPRNVSQRPFQYTTPCYESVNERRQLIDQSKKDGYNVDYFSSFTSINCLPDGTFGRTLINSNGT